MTKATGKIRDKVLHIQQQEQYQHAEMAHGYRATINHELRSPVQSCNLVLKNVLSTFE
jgi:hypothetical protein